MVDTCMMVNLIDNDTYAHIWLIIHITIVIMDYDEAFFFLF